MRLTQWLGVILALLLAIPVTAGPPAAASTLAGVPTPEGETASPDWVETLDGNLPIILSVPHGGELRPEDIPDRQDAILLNDPGSLQFALDLAQALSDVTGRQPYLVINHLARSKLDPNRSLRLGAQGNPSASAAWKAYHDALVRAERMATHACGWGAYFDLHSNGRPEPRVEFGYGLSVDEFDQSDEALDNRQYVLRSNIRSLGTWAPADFSQLLRGPGSLGGLLEAHGYSVTPSPENPVPQADYFDGGLSVALHGSRSGGSIDAVQIEVPFTLLDDSRRPFLARLLAEAIVTWMDRAYGFELASDGPICSGFADVRLDAPGGQAVAALSQVDGLPDCGNSPRRLCPGAPLTRVEAAQAVWRLLEVSGIPQTRAGGNAYADLPPDPTQKRAIEALAGRGLLQACAVDPLRYCPAQLEGRSEAAFLGMRLLEGASYVPPPPRGLFADVSTASWSAWWLEAAFENGLMSVCGGSSTQHICPQAPISRHEFALLVTKALSESGP